MASEWDGLLKAWAEKIDAGIEDEGIVLYDYVLEKLRELAVPLLDAGQAMRMNIGAYAVALNANPFKQEDTSRAIRGCVDGLQAWDAALKGSEHAKSSQA